MNESRIVVHVEHAVKVRKACVKETSVHWLRYVPSDNEPTARVRVVIFRRVRPDHVRRADGEGAAQPHPVPAELDRQPLQGGVRHLHAGLGGRTH